MRAPRVSALILVVAFLGSTAFFLWQHSTGVGWDFAAYSLNARYWFDGGTYFQALRPPLAPLLIGLFGLLSKAGAEYLFIAAAALLFAFSSFKLAGRLGLPPDLFYVLSLTPFLLVEGFKNGTELFCLALLELVLVCRGRAAAPLFLGLAVLTRYPAAAFGVLLLCTRDVRALLRDALIAAAVCAPWLVYNQIVFGHWAASFMDSYAMNMTFRGYLAGPFRWAAIGAVGLWLLPLAAAGVVFLGIRWRRAGRIEPDWALILVFLVLAVSSYARIQQKQTRYLFDLTLPLAALAALVLSRLSRPVLRAAAAAVLALLSAGSIAQAWHRSPESVQLDDVRVYRRVMAEVGPRLGACRLGTNACDFINYFGRSAEPFPMVEAIEARLAEGYRLLYFKNLGEPKLSRAVLDHLPIQAETAAYVLLGREGGCLPVRPYIYRYLDLKKENFLMRGRRDFPDTLLKLLFYKDKSQTRNTAVSGKAPGGPVSTTH
jgi:hypothetical protein